MTKADLVESICERLGCSKKEASEVVELIFSIIKDALRRSGRAKITGFGTFVANDKRARRGRNPQTGAAITIEPRKVLTFKPSALLKQAVNSTAKPSR